jgi:hypothetical protein
MMPILFVQQLMESFVCLKSKTDITSSIGFNYQLKPSQEVYKNLNDIIRAEIREARRKVEPVRQKLSIFDLSLQLSAGRGVAVAQT